MTQSIPITMNGVTPAVGEDLPVVLGGDFACEGSMSIDGSLVVNGSLLVRGTLTVIGALTVNGQTTLGGDLQVNGFANFAKTAKAADVMIAKDFIQA